jgi:hypothetical protein
MGIEELQFCAIQRQSLRADRRGREHLRRIHGWRPVHRLFCDDSSTGQEEEMVSVRGVMLKELHYTS